MAKRKAKPQTTAELRKELRAHINPLVRTVNDHSDEFGRIVARANSNVDIHNALAATVDKIDERSKVYEPHTDTMVDVPVLQRRVADAFDDLHRLRVEIQGLRDLRNLDQNDFRNHINAAAKRREIAEHRYSTFGARLRWLLTGK